MSHLLERISITIFVLVAVVYAYDEISVRHRMSAQKQGDPFDVVIYPHVLAIPQKGNRIEYELDAQSPLESQPCVHSLFPHFGYTPCWYIHRYAKDPTPMVILFVRFRDGESPFLTWKFRAFHVLIRI